MILRLSIPASITCFIMRTQDTVNFIFLGHLGNPALVAGVGVGACYTNIMGMIAIFGMNMALDTLISQAFGAGNL